MLRFALPLVIIGAMSVYGASSVKAQTFQDSALLSAARGMIIDIRYCTLITQAADGTADARTMDPFPPDSTFTIWFGTNRHSRKVAQIRANPQVTLHWFDPADPGYVVIKGRATVVDDAALEARFWKDEWEGFYPDRAGTYVVIRVVPQHLEIVSTRRGILGDPASWKVPAVQFHRR